MAQEKLDEKHFIRYKMFGQKRSAIGKYAELTIGKLSIVGLIKYELMSTFLSPFPGAIGFFLRKIFYKRLFKNVGTGIIWGKSITLRHPDMIHFGNRIVIDDYALIDARGVGKDGIYIGDDVIIGRGVIIQAKVGGITIGSHTSIGAGASIISQGGVVIGESVNIAGNCSIAGGAYKVGRNQDSAREHGKVTYGPIRVDKKCRLGMEVMVLDGIHIKEGTILGAKSLVTKDLPEYCVAVGIPAEIKYFRDSVSDNNKTD